MRKSLFFAVFSIILSMAGLAQNDKISYQAVVRNSANQLVHDQDLDVTVSIANSETGTAVYTETHTVHSNANGLISLLIGDGAPVAGSNWDAIQWNKAWVTAVVSQGGTALATHHLPLSAVPYALYADQVDPTALANYLTANHYLTEEVQVLSVSNDTLYLTGGSWVKLPQGFSGDYNDLTNLPDLTQYATNVHLNDTLNAYFDSTEVKTAIHDTADAIRAAIPASQVNADWNATGGPAEILNKPDLSVYATKDTLNAFATKDTLSSYATKDTLAYYATTDALKDSLTRYVGKEKLNDTLDAYFDSTQVKKAIHDTANVLRGEFPTVNNGQVTIAVNRGTVDNPTFQVNQDGSQTVTINIPDEVTVNNGQFTVITPDDTTRFTANQSGNDTVNLTGFVTTAHLNDTLNRYYTKTEVDAKLADTAKYALRTALADTAHNIRRDICDSATLCMERALANPNSAINHAVDTIALNSVKDTLDKYVLKIAVRDSITNNVGLTIKSDSLFLKSGDDIDTVKLPAVPEQVKSNWNETDASSAAYILNKPIIKDSVNMVVKDSLQAANSAINIAIDTIARHNISDSTRMVFDTLHTYYATNDTLKNFLTINGLCDSLVKCDVIKTMRDSIRDNAAAIQTNATNIQTNATNIQTNATNIGLNKQAIIDSSAHIRNDIENGQITIAVNRSATASETTVTNPTFGVNQEANQTVTITIPQETTVNNGQLTIVAAGDTTRFMANQATNDTVRLNKFATKDTLSKYTTTDKIDTIVNKHHFLTSDSTLIVRMRDSIQKVNAHVSADSLVLANRITNDSTKLVERIVADSTALAEKIYTDSLALAQRMDTAYKYLCDSIEKNCTNVALKNKDNLFTLRNQFDSTVFFKDATYFDSTAYFNERAYFDEDVNVKGDVIFKGYNYYFSVNNFYEHGAIVLIDEAVNPNTLGPVQSTPDNNLNRRLAVNYNDLMVVYDSLNLKAQIDNSALANRIVADSNRLVVFQNKVHEDSLTLANRIHADSITLTSKIRTDSIALVNRIVADSSALVNRIVADSTALAEKIKADSLTLATRMDTVYKHLCDSVMNCDGIKALQTADNNLSTRIHNDSLKLVDFKTKVHEDSLTLANRIHADSVTLTNKIRTDSVALVNRIVADSSALVNRIVADSTALAEKIKADSTTLATRMDTVYKHLCDSVMNCDGIKALQTADNNLSTRIHNDSLKLVDFKTKVHNDSLTLANRIHADSVTLTNKIRNDSVALVNRIVADSSALVNRIVADSTALAAKEKADSAYLKGLIDNIPLANDKTITITTNGNSTGVTNGVFSLNQSMDQTIDIEVPTKLSDLPNDGGKYARRDSVNVFTENNAFTDTVTVPNGYVLRGENATNESNCGNIVVNACDLWAVFDSLDRRMKALEDELATIKSATPPVFNSITLSDITTTSMKVTSSFTSTGVDITSYKFCYSENSNMSESTCITISEPEITLTGLDPYTRYYVNVAATNMIGTTTSTIADAKTLADAPTATVTGETTAPSGITVTLSNLNFKQPGEGTVQIYYKKKTDASCSTNLDGYTALNPSGTISSGDPYSQTISGLEDETVYCVIVKLQNENNVTYKEPIEVMSGPSNYLIVSSQYYSVINDDDIWLCKNAPVSVTYTVNPLIGDIEDYEDFSWRYYQSETALEEHHNLPTVSSEVANGSSYTITISATSNSHDAISIECTAKHKVTGALIKGKWEDLRTRNQVQQNIPTANFDVTYLTVTALTSYSKVDWGDGSAVQEGVVSGTEHLYQNEGTYTVTLINIYPDYYGGAGCIATGTVTVVTPPANIYVCSGTPHQGGVYEGQGFNGANDGYEEGSNGQITSVTDYDGNVYPVVQIGSQCWIAKNMRCEHSPITGSYIVNYYNYSGDTYRKTYASKSAHWLHNDPSYASSDLGLLYNFCAAADVYNGTELTTLNQNSWTPTINTPYHRGICPKGWHLPTYDDWNTLRNNENANTAAKVAGDGWPSPSGGCGNNNPCGTLNHNLSGFSALLTCYMNYNAWSTLRTDGTGFWSSTCTSGKASGCVMTTGSGSLPLSNNYYLFRNLFSVRCIRNEGDDPSGGDPTPPPAVVSLSVTSDHSQVQLCTTNGNSLYPSYAPVEVTYTATLSCEDPNTDLTGYSYNWSITPSGYGLTTDGGNTCTVIYSTEPGSQPHISCTATKAEVPDVAGSYNQSFANPSKVFPEYVLCVDTMSVMLRTNSNAFGIQSDYTINWGDGSATVTGLTSTKTSGPQHPYAEPGTYSITVTNAAGCPLTKQATVAHAISTRFPCTGTAHQGTEYQSYGLTQKDGYEYTNNDGITAVTDYDGNVYPVVQIGNKCWMKENLRCTHSPNTGTSIVNPLNASGNSFTRSKTSKVAQWYQNNQITSESMGYGLYYNWCATMDIYYPGGNELPQAGQSETDWAYTVSNDHRGICPRGWHVPSQEEFNTLLSNAGGGTALAGSCQWNYCFGNAKDFYAIPSGMSTSSGGFHSNSLVANGGVVYAYYWSSTEYGSNKDRVYPLQLYNASVGDPAFTSVSSSTTYGGSFKDYGHSVRCVRDSE